MFESSRTATRVVAASDADDRSKIEADFICDGTDDDVEIQAALDNLPALGGEVHLTEGNFSLTSQLARTINNITVSGVGKSTRIALNGVTAVITAGAQTGWVFSEFDTDAGDLIQAADTVANYWGNGTRVFESTLTFDDATSDPLPADETAADDGAETSAARKDHRHRGHATAHTIASHSDTTATGPETETLTDGSDADALHTHPGSAAASHAMSTHSDEDTYNLVTTGVITGATLEPTAATSNGDQAAIGREIVKGIVITGTGTSNDITLENTTGNPVMEVLNGSSSITITNSVFMKEVASAIADVVAQGQFWVLNDAPNIPMYTDDDGTDIELGVLRYADTQLTNTQILNLNTAPIELVAAPGTGLGLIFERAYLLSDNTSVYTESDDDLRIELDDGTDVSQAIDAAALVGTTSSIVAVGQEDGGAVGGWQTSASVLDDAALQIANRGDGDWGGGNAANTISIRVWYTIAPTTPFS